MRRRWKTLKSVLTGKKADETPCFAYDSAHPLGCPVAARITDGRIEIFCPEREAPGCQPLHPGTDAGQNASELSADNAVPQIEVQVETQIETLIETQSAPRIEAAQCRLMRDAEGNASIWLGLHPGITVSGLRAVFKEDPCRTLLVCLARLASHLDDLADEEDILAELRVLCRRVEERLRAIFKEKQHCRRVKRCTDMPKGLLRWGLSRDIRTESRAGQLMRRLAAEGSLCAFTPAQLCEAASAFQHEQAGLRR